MRAQAHVADALGLVLQESMFADHLAAIEFEPHPHFPATAPMKASPFQPG